MLSLMICVACPAQCGACSIDVVRMYSDNTFIKFSLEPAQSQYKPRMYSSNKQYNLSMIDSGLVQIVSIQELGVSRRLKPHCY